MSMFSGIVRILTGVIKFVNGTGGSLSTFATKMFAELPMVIDEIKNIINFHKDGLDDVEKLKLIKSALLEFDMLTGVDGLSFFHSVTDEERIHEENALDNFVRFVWFVVLDSLNIPFVEYDSVEV